MAELGSIYQYHVFVVGIFIQKQYGYIGTGIGENVARHTDYSAQPAVVYQSFAYFLFYTALCRNKSRRHYYGCFTVIAELVHNVLDKQQVNGHRLLFFVGYFGYARKKPLFKSFFLQLGMKIGKVQLKRRVGNNVVKFPIQIIRLCQGVGLDHIGYGMGQIVSTKFSRSILLDFWEMSSEYMVQLSS